MGFDPMTIDYLRISQERGLGTADPRKINVCGVNINKVNFGFKKADTLASRGQKLIYHHSPVWLEKLLLQTIIAPWSFLASRTYFDIFWYNAIGKKRLDNFLDSGWGKVFKSYSGDTI
jgi:hypothetical protein